jgi:hypothetical protein
VFCIVVVLVGAVGIEHDPIFLSPTISRRCNRLPNPIADSADYSTDLNGRVESFCSSIFLGSQKQAAPKSNGRFVGATCVVREEPRKQKLRSCRAQELAQSRVQENELQWKRAFTESARIGMRSKLRITQSLRTTRNARPRGDRRVRPSVPVDTPLRPRRIREPRPRLPWKEDRWA